MLRIFLIIQVISHIYRTAMIYILSVKSVLPGSCRKPELNRGTISGKPGATSPAKAALSILIFHFYLQPSFLFLRLISLIS